MVLYLPYFSSSLPSVIQIRVHTTGTPPSWPSCYGACLHFYRGRSFSGFFPHPLDPCIAKKQNETCDVIIRRRTLSSDLRVVTIEELFPLTFHFFLKTKSEQRGRRGNISEYIRKFNRGQKTEEPLRSIPLVGNPPPGKSRNKKSREIIIFGLNALR